MLVHFSNFILDEWKKVVANTDELEVAQKYLWENFDANAYSMWTYRYNTPEENRYTMNASNLIKGFKARTERLSKFVFGLFNVANECQGDINAYGIEGFFIFSGQRYVFDVSYFISVKCVELVYIIESSILEMY